MVKMKHYVLMVEIGTTVFERVCSSIIELYDAVTDLHDSGVYGGDMERIMEAIVGMKRGNLNSYSHSNIRIKVMEGEI